MRWFASAVPAGFGALVGCIVGAGFTWWIAPSGSPTPKPSAEKVSQTSQRSPKGATGPQTEQDDESDEITALALRLRSLDERVSLLTAALGRAQGTRTADANDDGPAAADVADPVFEAAVRDILDRVDQERQDERIQRSQQRAERGAQRAAERLSSTLGLTNHQQEQLQQVFHDHYDALRKLRDSDDQPSTPGEWREKWRELRDQAEKELERVLDKSQLEKYRSLDESEFFGGPRVRGARRE